HAGANGAGARACTAAHGHVESVVGRAITVVVDPVACLHAGARSVAIVTVAVPTAEPWQQAARLLRDGVCSETVAVSVAILHEPRSGIGEPAAVCVEGRSGGASCEIFSARRAFRRDPVDT